MNNINNEYFDNEYNQDIKALIKVTLNRLLSINKVIRLNRNKMTKDSLIYYKEKRKETDILLSNIKTSVSKLDFHDLKQRYMSFEIQDPRFL